MRFLLDTNVISELRKTRPSKRVLNWVTQNEYSSGISSLVIGELVKGAHKQKSANQTGKLLQWIAEIEELFESRIFPIDRETIWKWGEISGQALRNGNQLTVIDSLIAATALANDLVLVTRNVDDFPESVSIYNPW